MSLDVLFELAWKSVLCTGFALLALHVLRKRSAAERSTIAALGLLTLLLLPASTALLPGLELAAPEPVAAVAERIEALTEGVGAPPANTSSSASATQAPWEAIVLGAYLLPAVLLLLGLLLGIARLWRIHAHARVIEAAPWLTALARAQNRLGLKHGAALLTSAELSSPVSWGAIRPTIIVDEAAAGDPEQADAIVAHELAHVARLDWLRLIAGRLAICLFWFNPLVWLLARQSHQLCEEAADDAVLRADIDRVRYADVLANAARQASRPRYLPLHPVAPTSSALRRRIAHVLDGSQPRGPATAGWVAAALLLASGLNLAVASAEPVLILPAPGLQTGAGERAAVQLERLETPQARTIGRAIRERNWAARRVNGRTGFSEKAAVAPLVEALRDDRPEVRRIAAWGLSELGEVARPKAEEPVAMLLRDSSPEVRAAAARTLGDFYATDRAADVSRLLRDPEWRVRWHAAHALGDLQDPATRRTLEAALNDPDQRVRAKVAWALRQVAEMESTLERYAGR